MYQNITPVSLITDRQIKRVSTLLRNLPALNLGFCILRSSFKFSLKKVFTVFKETSLALKLIEVCLVSMFNTITLGISLLELVSPCSNSRFFVGL